MIYILFIFFYIKCIGSDWIEILPIRNAKNYSVSTSTPSTYEVMMRAPFSTPIITTPAYETNAEPTLIEKEFKTNRNVFNNKSEQLNEVNNDVPHNGFFGFLQAIQQNLLKSVSHESKISVLMNLRDTLLSNLHTRISKLWKREQDDKNEARGYKDEHEMDFPSNEGALMTIGFLTFAVFLIKLVIKLVQALKYKYTYYGTTTTTTAATLILLKRKKREEFNDETARITAYIDKLPY